MRREYVSHDMDNRRWEGFEFRAGDVVIVAPSKSGTTWTQLLVALLIFEGPDLPQPLGQLSPWMDHQVIPVAQVHELLERQTHRRLIKTHTPLDGLPSRDDIFYVCVGRDPRDAVISMGHHMANLDRERMNELLPDPRPSGGEDDVAAGDPLDRFINGPADDWTLAWLAHFYRTFWDKRHLQNVELFHFADYLRDLPAQVVRLARFLAIPVDMGLVRELAEMASLDNARAKAHQVAPEAHLEMWKDPASFFRSGRVGEYRERFTPQQLDRYAERVEELMAPPLADWVHNGTAR